MSFVLVRYLLFQTVYKSVLLLGLLIGIYCTIDIVELGSVLDSFGFIRFYYFKLPEIISHMLPLAICLGTLVTINGLKQSGEWTALNMATLSDWHILLPIISVCIFSTLLNIFFIHYIVPSSTKQFEKAQNRQSLTFSNISKVDSQIVQQNVFSSTTPDLLIIERTDQGRIEKIEYTADTSKAETLYWDTQKGFFTQPNGNRKTVALAKLPVFSTNGLYGASLTTYELKRVGELAVTKGIFVAPLNATISLRHSLVLSSLLITLLAVWCFLRLRLNGWMVSVFTSLLMCILFYIFVLMGYLAASHGVVPSFAVWAITLLGMFGAVGAVEGIISLRRR